MSKRVKNGSPLVAVAYVRVSKDDQKLGPEAQRASIEAWAAREGVKVAAWHVDAGVCSVTPIDQRPALVAALAALRDHGAGVLVVAKRDRIARDPGLTASVERAAADAGAVVRSAAGEGNGSTPADEFMRGVIDSASRYERALIRARTTAALAVIRARGQKTGGSVPYGYALAADGRTLVAVEGEQATIARARALAADGRPSESSRGSSRPRATSAAGAWRSSPRRSAGCSTVRSARRRRWVTAPSRASLPHRWRLLRRAPRAVAAWRAFDESAITPLPWFAGSLDAARTRFCRVTGTR